MDYYFDVCIIFIEPESKYENFKSNTQKEFDKCKHKELTIENIDIKDVDKAFHEYIIEHNRKYDYYLVECDFRIVFNDYEFCPYVSSTSNSNKRCVFGRNFSKT